MVKHEQKLSPDLSYLRYEYLLHIHYVLPLLVNGGPTVYLQLLSQHQSSPSAPPVRGMHCYHPRAHIVTSGELTRIVEGGRNGGRDLICCSITLTSSLDPINYHALLLSNLCVMFHTGHGEDGHQVV